MKKTIEIDDTLYDIEDSVISELKDYLLRYLEENPDLDEVPDLYNDLDYDGSFHEIVDSSVPIYTHEIETILYLHGNEVETSFEDAGIGEKEDKGWPMGWKAAAIYCYLEQKAAEWYQEESEGIFEHWKKEYPDKEGEE